MLRRRLQAWLILTTKPTPTSLCMSEFRVEGRGLKPPTFVAPNLLQRSGQRMTQPEPTRGAEGISGGRS